MKKLLLLFLLTTSIGISQSISAFEFTNTEMKEQNSTAKYLTSYTDFNFNNIGFKFNNVNPTNGQIKISTASTNGFNFYNTDAIPGLTKVTIYLNGGFTESGTWYMSTGTSTISSCATTTDIKGTYNSANKTLTFAVDANTSKPVSYFHINLTTKGKGAMFFTSIVVDAEQNNKLGTMTVTAGGKKVETDESGIETATITQGQAIEMEANNATEFVVGVGNTEKGYTATEGKASWIPTELYTDETIMITPYMGEVGGDPIMFNLTVLPPRDELEIFEWKPSSVTITQGEEFTAPALSCSVADLTITYYSTLPGVANVNQSGVITLRGETGKATITATFDGNAQYNGKVATCTIEVKKALAVKVPQHTGIWRVVTDVNELKDGEIYTIAGIGKDDETYAMSNEVNTLNNNIKATKVIVTNNQFSSPENVALVVLLKENDSYSFYLTNGKDISLTGTPDLTGYLTSAGLSKTTTLPDGSKPTGNKNQIEVTEEIAGNASVATIAINSTTGAATVKFKESSQSPNEKIRVDLCFNGTANSHLFSCYSLDNQSPIYFYSVLTPAPQVEVTLDTEAGYEVELSTEIEGAEIWYRVVPMTNAQKVRSREAAQEVPFEKAPTNNHRVTLKGDQQVDFYSVLYGRQSDYMSHSKDGGTTGIDEVKTMVEQGATEYYDLSGRRVNAPVKGIVIKKTGSKVSKVVF